MERSIFPLEVQEAFQLWDLLSDSWDGMNGYYLGKDYSALHTYIKMLQVTQPVISVYFLKHIDHYYSENVNSKLKQKRDAEERKAKMKR